MASYHLAVKSISRATGRSAPAAAAYRTASVIENQRDGLLHDYGRRSGVEAAFLITPDGVAWAADRSALWNAAEAAEKRKDAKVAREYEVALPCELDRAGRRELATGFAREVVARFGVAADVAIHAPHREGDGRNWHAHIMTTTRVATAEGLGAKTRELDVLQTSGPAVEALRELWAVQVNHALQRIGAEQRVDHRSYARRGEDVVASQHLGPAATGMERKTARQQARQEQGLTAEVQALGKTASVQALNADQAVSVPGKVAQPGQGQQAAQDGLERHRMAAERGLGSGRLDGAEKPKAAVRPSTDVSGAGRQPVTRIGQHNAEVQERNRAVAAARQALEAARRTLESLERAAMAGVQRVMSLARGLGAQAAAERERQAQAAERQREAARQAEHQRQEEQAQRARDKATKGQGPRRGREMER